MDRPVVLNWGHVYPGSFQETSWEGKPLHALQHEVFATFTTYMKSGRLETKDNYFRRILCYKLGLSDRNCNSIMSF